MDQTTPHGNAAVDDNASERRRRLTLKSRAAAALLDKRGPFDPRGSTNLEVPPHRYVGDTRLVIGEGEGSA